MSCGNTSCLDQQRLDFGDVGSGSDLGFMQVVPNKFTREELQAIRNKASDLLPWTNMAEFDLLEDLVATLDLLDALAAREEADLAELEETIMEHSGSDSVHFSPPLCSRDCPDGFHYHTRH